MIGNARRLNPLSLLPRKGGAFLCSGKACLPGRYPFRLLPLVAATFPKGTANSLSQNLTVLPAPSGREPLARPQTLRFSLKLCRYAKGPILEGAVERSETGGVSPSVRPSVKKVAQKRPQAFLSHKLS